ncbi:MAG: hypothetical protein ABL886_12700, partial [Rhodoglobus sp.]
MRTGTSVHRSALTLITAMALAVMLSACTPPDPAPTAGPGPDGSPTPTESAIPAVALAPEPVIGATCSEILSAASVAAAFPDALAVADPAQSTLAAAPAIVPAYVVRSLGGIACEWNNGETYSSSRGSNPDYSGVRVLVLPDATTQWDRYVAYYGSGGLGLYCGEAFPPYPLGCHGNDLVGSYWVETTISDATSAAAAATLHAAILAAVGSAGPGADAWTAPADTLPLPADCEGVVAVGTVQSALGVTTTVVINHAAGGWSLRAGADVNANSITCFWSYWDADAGVGGVRVLAAGVWAFTEVFPALAIPVSPEPLTLTGLNASDEAWIRCAPGNAECTVDLVIGGNWIEFDVGPDEGFGRVTV